ncbi:hypothetical protein F4677DRAFT_420488 [Hypoxylon crocopeplum]|nr:hypothetical protein F4677DRAFT_420488 [Hypoxylon crocopeplum]
MSRLLPESSANDRRPHPSPLQSILFLQATSPKDTAAKQVIAKSNDPAVIIAARQLTEHQERYGSDAVPPADLLAWWLEKNKEDFIRARRATRNRAIKRPPKKVIPARKAPAERQRRISSSNHPATSLSREPRTTGATGVIPLVHRCQHQIFKAQNRLCGFLRSAGVAVYPSGEGEHAQLNASETNVGYRDDHLDAAFPERGERIQHSRGAVRDGQNRDAKTALLGNSGDRPISHQRRHLQPRPKIRQQREVRARLVIDAVDKPHPSIERVPNDTPNPVSLSAQSSSKNSTAMAAALDQSRREAAPSPPESRIPFHINKVAHLAPTYIAAERAKARALLNNRSGQATKSNSHKQPVAQGAQGQKRNNSASKESRDALTHRILREGFLRGEMWIDGPDGESDGRRVGMRFVARPLTTPTAQKRRAHGLDIQDRARGKGKRIRT